MASRTETQTAIAPSSQGSIGGRWDRDEILMQVASHRQPCVDSWPQSTHAAESGPFFMQLSRSSAALLRAPGRAPGRAPCWARCWALCWVLLVTTGIASAQRHDMGSSPPTAPPSKFATPRPVLPATPDLGALTFVTDDVPVSAPQALAAQLRDSHDLTRAGALVAVGAPAWYLEQGSIPTPHSVRLDLLPLGDSRKLDAILTVELDRHIVSAILLPLPARLQASASGQTPADLAEKSPSPPPAQWYRIATLIDATSYGSPSDSLQRFLLASRSLVDPLRYTAVYHTITEGPNRDFKETEVRLQIFSGHAVITAGFTSRQRSCDDAAQDPCEITRRWLQPDPSDPRHRFLLVTATGYQQRGERGKTIAHTKIFEDSHLRTFLCQPLSFSKAALQFEPLSGPTACSNIRDTEPDPPLH